MQGNLDLFGPVQHHPNAGTQERIAILETRFDQLIVDVADIKTKMDELISLKHKGLGAFWLVGLLISTGIVGLVSAVTGFFNKGHL